MTRLCDLSVKHGSDKFVGGFTEFYDLILGHLNILKVLEIGIGVPEVMQHVPGYKAGASLRMWEEYFPGAQIFGMDIQPGAMVNEGRIQSGLFDQRRERDLLSAAEWIGEGIDLVIDDGDHNPLSQLLGAETLMPYLKNGGLYIIEDVDRPYLVSEKLPFPHTVVQTHAAAGKRRGSLILICKE